MLKSVQSFLGLINAPVEFIEWDEYARRINFINEFGRIQNEL